MERPSYPKTNKAIVSESASLQKKYAFLLSVLRDIDPDCEQFTDYTPSIKRNWDNSMAVNAVLLFDLPDLIHDLEKCAPHGHKFGVKEGFFGFWEISE